MKKVLSDTLALSVANFINRTKSLLLIPVIVGSVALEGYGAFVQVFLTARLVSSLASIELPIGFQRLASSEGQPLGTHLASVMFPTLGLALAGASAMFFGATWLSTHFFDGGFERSLELAAVVVVTNAMFSVARNFLRARRRFKEESVLTILYEVLPYLAFVALALATGEVLPGIVAYVAIDAGVAVVAMAWTLKNQSLGTPSWNLTREYARYSFPLSLSLLQSGLLHRADLYFLSFFMGLSAMATYNVVYQLAGVVQLVARPIQVQIMSYVSTSWDAGREEESTLLIRDILLVFLLIACGLVACVALYVSPFFEAVLDLPSDEHPLAAIAALVGVGLIANTLRHFFYVLIRLKRTTKDELGFQLGALAVNAIGNLLLIPWIGLLGAAIATLLSYGVLIPILTRRYELGLDRQFYGHAASLALLACVAIPVRALIVPDGIPLLFSSAAAAFTTYLVAVALTKWSFLTSLKDRLSSWRTLAPTTPAPV